MPDLRDLYQEVILDHSKRPRNFRKPDGVTRHADGYNPLCGDKVTVYLTIRDGVVSDAAFQGSGCAISTASASMMTESLKGRTVAEAEALFERFHEMLTSSNDAAAGAPGLGKLAVFAGVKEFPMRVKCATLAWHTLRSALSGGGEPVAE
jgi:nitrogen fixation protein NifU and related proteins